MRYLALFVCTVFSIILNLINILVNDVFHSLSYTSLKDLFPEIFLCLLISHHNRKTGNGLHQCEHIDTF